METNIFTSPSPSVHWVVLREEADDREKYALNGRMRRS